MDDDQAQIAMLLEEELVNAERAGLFISIPPYDEDEEMEDDEDRNRYITLNYATIYEEEDEDEEDEDKDEEDEEDDDYNEYYVSQIAWEMARDR